MTTDTSIPDRLRAIGQRNNMNNVQLAEYFGVPCNTLNNWLRGVREPTTSALRLLEVYAMLEVLAPGIHASFIPPRKPKGPRPKNERQEAQQGA